MKLDTSLKLIIILGLVAIISPLALGFAQRYLGNQDKDYAKGEWVSIPINTKDIISHSIGFGDINGDLVVIRDGKMTLNNEELDWKDKSQIRDARDIIYKAMTRSLK